MKNNTWSVFLHHKTPRYSYKLFAAPSTPPRRIQNPLDHSARENYHRTGILMAFSLSTIATKKRSVSVVDRTPEDWPHAILLFPTPSNGTRLVRPQHTPKLQQGGAKRPPPKGRRTTRTTKTRPPRGTGPRRQLAGVLSAAAAETSPSQ